MRGKSLICMLMVLALVFSLAIVNLGYGTPGPTVYVAPAVAVAGPTETVDININVSNCPDILGFQFKLRWDKSVLGFPPGPPYPGDNAMCNVTEGDFISSAGPTQFTVLPDFVQAFVHVGCHLTSTVVTPPSGNGTLATFSFYVLKAGVTNLTLFDVHLYDYATGGEEAIDATQNGYFYTTKPFVDFDWTPVSPEVNEMATFDASACWDPDGGSIMNYTWNFGDGNTTITYTPIVKHKFAAYSEAGWTVALTAADDENETWTTPHSLIMWHDIQSVDIWPAIFLPYDWWWLDTVDRKVIRGEWLWVLGTCTNMGTYTDTSNVTLTATGISGPATGTVIALPCTWGGGPVVAETIPPHAGSGWDLMFDWATDAAVPGVYELKLVAAPVPGETSIANNNLTLTVEILPYGELSESLNELIPRPPALTGVIDIQDVIICALAFGSTPQSARWNPLCDFNLDNLIDISDLVQIGIAFGTVWN